MAETGLSKNKLIAELTRSAHGKLNEYTPIVTQAVTQQGEFLAHLVAWNHLKGQIRDSKIALPVASLVDGQPEEFIDNALAHLAKLGPREFLRGYRFTMESKTRHRSRQKRLVHDYLAHKEANAAAWDRIMLQHRHTLKELGALSHYNFTERTREILFYRRYPTGSLFEKVAQLKDMSPTEAAGTIMQYKLPFLICLGALGKKAQDPDLVLALINRMSPTELVTNTKMLERLGVNKNPALRGAFQEALGKAASSKANVLKTSVAVDAVDDWEIKEKLRGLQDKQLAQGGVEGSWLVLADKSGSMSQAIEVARRVAATLAKMVKGKVWLTFFDTAPQTIDVTGAPLDVIQKATRYIQAGGGTSIGCGLARMLDERQEIDGIAIISDAQENEPPYFHDAYKRYTEMYGKEVPVYLYHCGSKDGTLQRLMKNASQDLQVFDLPANLDYYSLPNLVATMRTNRYSLVDEIMAVPLATLTSVLPNAYRKEVTNA